MARGSLFSKRKIVIFRCWGAEEIAHEEGCSRFAAEKKKKEGSYLSAFTKTGDEQKGD